MIERPKIPEFGLSHRQLLLLVVIWGIFTRGVIITRLLSSDNEPGDAIIINYDCSISNPLRMGSIASLDPDDALKLFFSSEDSNNEVSGKLPIYIEGKYQMQGFEAKKDINGNIQIEIEKENLPENSHVVITPQRGAETGDTEIEIVSLLENGVQTNYIAIGNDLSDSYANCEVVGTIYVQN